MVVEQLEIHNQTNEPQHELQFYTKINSKCITDLKHQSIKLLGKKTTQSISVTLG